MGIQKKLISLKYLMMREVQIKTRDSYIFIKLTKIRKQNNANVNKMLGYSDFHSRVMEVCSRTHTQGIIQTQLIKLRKSVPRDSKMGLLDMYFKKKSHKGPQGGMCRDVHYHAVGGSRGWRHPRCPPLGDGMQQVKQWHWYHIQGLRVRAETRTGL